VVLRIKPGTKFPFTVEISDESMLGSGHTWDSVADWCVLLIGPMDEWWTLDSNGECMVWGFKRKEDAGLFHLTWGK
jgi:hypothetical protein